jgi:hypothetical protein
MANNTVTEVATVVEKGLTEIQTIAPFAERLLKLFPGFGEGASVAFEFAVALIPDVLDALHEITEKNGGDLIQARVEVAAHLNSNMPNSPFLQPSKDNNTNVSTVNN